MRYVIDSSVAFKWLVPEVHSDKALALRDAFRNGVHELLAPDVFPAEVTHALTRGQRQSRVTVPRGGQLFADLLYSLPPLHPTLPLLPRAYAISTVARIGVYDCLYVALAEREGCEFVTADARLVTNLQAQFPFLVLLDSLP